MRISHRVLALLGPVILSSALCAGQTPATLLKEPTASISGRVTIAGKSASGVTVVATVSNSMFDNKTVAKATTDDEGNYKLNRLAAGRVKIFPLSKAYIVAAGEAYKKPEQQVNVADGETITKIDFALVRGGVITGRITDADGRPLIGERVTVALKYPTEGSQEMMFDGSRNQTDDRGVYRVYGLSPGMYIVSVGQASAEGGVTVMGLGGSQYVKTFYPGVQDEMKASVLEIKEGREFQNIDITVGKPGGGFSVVGRVIDAESGEPAPNLYIGHSSFNETTQEMGQMNFSGTQSDPNGKFRLEGLRPGHYAVYTFAAQPDNSTYSEPARFEISDGDVTGIEIKVRRGATLSGVAILENASDLATAIPLQTVNLYAFVEKKDGAPSFSRGQIAADGTFSFSGLAPGRARIGIQGFPAPPKGLALARTELDGVEQAEGIEITAGAKVSGVRLVFIYGTGSVRGDVKVEGGLPQGTQIVVRIRAVSGDARRFNRITEIDARLHFVVENIPPGNYELTVEALAKSGAGPGPPVELLKQGVTVTNGAETKVNLVVELPKKGGQQ